ncbi:MAG TPA: AMP-binding protein [Acidimicrobiales bacterium]
MAQLPPEQLHTMAEAFGDHIAYRVVGGGSMTFTEWDTAATCVARGLLEAGVEPGDRVTLHLEAPNALRWMIAYAAIHRAGGVAVPLNPQLTRPEVERMLDHCGAVVALVEESLADRYQGTRTVVATVPGPGGAGENGENDGRSADPVPGPRWDQLLDCDPTYFQVLRDCGDLADILYTSGTTGHPKAVAVRHDNSSLVPFKRPQWSGGGWLHASPPYTFAGLAFVYTPMKLGLQGIYLPRFDAGMWLDTVETDRPGFVFLVPAMATLLLEHPRFETADLGSVVQCTVGSAPLSPRVLERLQEKMPDALVSNNYGMTEAGSVYCLMPPGEAVKRPGSVGKPLAPAEIVCVDEGGAAVAADEVGHVRMRIPGRPREYYGDAEATARTWVDGWLVTGDLGKLDGDGYLYIVGRSKDVIIRGGNNIHPTDVEHAVASHPAVREVSVLGVEHPVLGEDVVAFVALRPGAAADADELRDHTLGLLARYKVPRQWYFVDELPRNATGKVVKDRLRERHPAAPPAPGDDAPATGDA